MNSLSTAWTLLLLNGAVSQMCPRVEKYTKLAPGNMAFTFKYVVILASTTNEFSILCVNPESSMGGWMGFGISPTGKMDSDVSMRRGASSACLAMRASRSTGSRRSRTWNG